MINDKAKVYFPLDLEPRRQQIDMLEFTKKSINNSKKYILINAPTGSGKSYFVIMFANWYKNFIDNESTFDILTNSKILQDQYIDSFPFISNLKGMTNYHCSKHNTNCAEGKELNKILKYRCKSCPYDNAKLEWKDSDMSITNFALFNSLSLFTDNIKNKKNNVLIIDESHEFESSFCNFISFKLNGLLLKKCGFNKSYETMYYRKLKTIKNVSDFILYINDTFIPELEILAEKHLDSIDSLTERSQKLNKQKNLEYCNSTVNRLTKLIETYDEDRDNWVLDINTIDNKIELNLQPIWGYPFLKKIVWSEYDHIIFLSGTILNKRMFSYINGLNEKLTSYIEMDSTFPIKNRPIYYVKLGKMTFKEKVNTFKKQVPIIKKILKKYKNKKGIIHTTNYEITKWLKENIDDKRLVYHDPSNREEVYKDFLKTKKPNIIVSPSMSTGISLDDELGRFSIILKIGYPNISSNKIKEKQRSNRDWYSWQTCLNTIQSYGRILRSDNDYGDTFILDESFSDIMKYNSNYLPKDFTKAIKLINV